MFDDIDSIVVTVDSTPDNVLVPFIHRTMLFMESTMKDQAFDAFPFEHCLDEWGKSYVSMTQTSRHGPSKLQSVRDKCGRL